MRCFSTLLLRGDILFATRAGSDLGRNQRRLSWWYDLHEFLESRDTCAISFDTKHIYIYDIWYAILKNYDCITLSASSPVDIIFRQWYGIPSQHDDWGPRGFPARLRCGKHVVYSQWLYLDTAATLHRPPFQAGQARSSVANAWTIFTILRDWVYVYIYIYIY